MKNIERGSVGFFAQQEPLSPYNPETDNLCIFGH
jgi:hypothetical protein